MRRLDDIVRCVSGLRVIRLSAGVCPLFLTWWSWLCFAPQGVAQVMIQSFQLSSCALFNAQMQDVSLHSPRDSTLSHVPVCHARYRAQADAHTNAHS